MAHRRPRLVLAAATVVLLAVLGAFAVAIVRAQEAERQDARERFLERAEVSAALTESLFASTSSQTAERYSEQFGDRAVEREKLERVVRRGEGGTQFVLVTDDEGAVLGSTTDDPALSARVANAPAVVRAQEGASYMLSDYLPGIGANGSAAIVYSIAFDTAYGRRVFVSAFGGPLISTFLGGYLARIPGAQSTNAYIVDSAGLVVGSPVRDQAPGEPVEEDGVLAALRDADRQGEIGNRHFAAVPVSGSSWKVALTIDERDLYTGISSTIEWLILLGLAIAGGVAMLALHRTTRAAVEVDRANARLESTNSELARSNLELQRSNAELEQFASVASHDLQEPLRKVQTFGDQIESRFGDEVPDEALDYLRRMRRAAARMSILIEDLLRFSRVTTRAQPAERVDLGRVAHEVLSDLETAVAEAHADVRIGELPAVEADPSQMRQLLQNLIANGIKFSRPGVAPVIEVRPVPAAPGFIAFEVADNGIGIEPEYAERIFRVFERLHPRDVYEGTGIGLALCRKIAERHGGTVEVSSTPGEGATFRVALPAADREGRDRHEPAGMTSAGAHA